MNSGRPYDNIAEICGRHLKGVLDEADREALTPSGFDSLVGPAGIAASLAWSTADDSPTTLTTEQRETLADILRTPDPMPPPRDEQVGDLEGITKGPATPSLGHEEPSVSSYRERNKACLEVRRALQSVGYADSTKLDGDERVCNFWFDLVMDGFLDRRGENTIPEAKKRGCPVSVLSAEYDRLEWLQTAQGSARLSKLQDGMPPFGGEDLAFPIWNQN